VSRLRHERGQDLVEYAVILPVLLLLVISIMQFGLIMFSYNTIADAAREGARFGAVHCSSFRPACTKDDPDIIAAARALTTGLNLANLTITQPAPSGGSIQVTVKYTVNLIPFIPARTGVPSTLTLQAVSTMQTE
jgi:Flp pilus assembly protein TadG